MWAIVKFIEDVEEKEGPLMFRDIMAGPVHSHTATIYARLNPWYASLNSSVSIEFTTSKKRVLTSVNP